MTRKALVGYLNEEQHKIRSDTVGHLLDDFGDGFTLTRAQLKELLKQQTQSAKG